MKPALSTKLYSMCFPIQPAEKEAQKNSILDLAKLLIDKGCDASAKDKSGNTPINLALQQVSCVVW